MKLKNLKNDEIFKNAAQKYPSILTNEEYDRELGYDPNEDGAYTMLSSLVEKLDKRALLDPRILNTHKINDPRKKPALVAHHNWVNFAGDSFLHYLAEHGMIEALQHNEAASRRNAHGETPLHLYTKNDNPSGPALKHPAVASTKDKNGNTPLHNLAVRGVWNATNHPKFQTVKNFKKETPYDLWVKNKHPFTTIDAFNAITNRDEPVTD